MDLAVDVLQVLVLGWLVFRDWTRKPEVRETVTIKEVPRPARRAPLEERKAPGREATFKRKRERWTDASNRPAKV